MLLIQNWNDFIFGAITGMLFFFGLAVTWAVFYLSKKNAEKERISEEKKQEWSREFRLRHGLENAS